MRIIYTHRTQGVGAEGAHIKGMFEAFRNLGHAISMDCLPGCNPSELKPGPTNAAASGKTVAADSSKANATGLRRFYRIIADRAPQALFEMIELSYNLPLLARLGWRCFRERPQLIYERYSLNTFAPTWVCKWFGIKHVLEVNDSVVIERSRPLDLRWVSERIEGYCLKGADLSITITDHFAHSLRARFGEAFPLTVLTNGVARARFQGPFQRMASREKFGLNSATVLGGTGQFLPWHGLQDLVEIMGPRAQELDIRFLFIGDGPARQDVEAAAARLGISDRVQFTGMLPIDTVPDCLSALDIAVIPKAAPHASPMKLIEYMAIGLPIVAPGLSSIRAALADETMGALFPAGDMQAMGTAIHGLLRDPESARQLGERARQHVFSHLTWDRHAEHVLSAIGLT
jgi:glycosyltransferase involved in cell wall biosynthesis